MITMNKEIWKDVYFVDKGITYDYRGFYQVSNMGRIRSCDRYVKAGIKYNNKILHNGKIIKPIKLKSGYYLSSLSKECKKEGKLVHRIVAFVFIPNPDNLPCVNYKDGNKQNNCVDNLEWCTYKDNEKHSWEILGKQSANKRKINQYDLQGNFIKTWDSISEAQKKLKINNISRACIKLKNTSGCYIWRYVDEKKN